MMMGRLVLCKISLRRSSRRFLDGLLQMAVNDRFLVQIQGKKLTEDELADLAAGVKVDGLKGMK